jgi:hypothetical protein
METEIASRGSFGVSATCYRRAEYVCIIAVVIAPFEFRDVIFATDFVKAAHFAALQQRPEPINRLSMNRTVDLLARLTTPCFISLR